MHEMKKLKNVDISENTILSEYVKRLSTANLRSSLLNCVPGTSIHKFDITELNILDRLHAQEILEQITSKEDATITVDLNFRDSHLRDYLKSKNPNAKEDIIQSMLQGLREKTNLKVDKCIKKLEKIFYDNRQEKQDHGTNSLMLGYPVISVINNKNKRIYAPLFLWPIQVNQSNKSSNTWILTLNTKDREIRINDTFTHWLKVETGIEIPEIPRDYFDDGILDISEINSFIKKLDNVFKADFEKIHPKKIEKLKIIEDTKAKVYLINSAVIAFYKATRQAILDDMKSMNSDVDFLSKSNIVQKILFAEEKEKSEKATLRDVNDNSYGPSHITVLPVDFSQKQAVFNSLLSEGAVIHGPPGTGKSQTITELVYQAMRNQQKVLICCEKKAALEVVVNRLGKFGLDMFCVKIQDEVADRTKIFEKYRLIHECIKTRDSSEIKKDLSSFEKQIIELEDQLKKYSNLLYKKSDEGFSWPDLISAYSKESKKMAPYDIDPKSISKLFIPEGRFKLDIQPIDWPTITSLAEESDVYNNKFVNKLNFGIKEKSADFIEKIKAQINECFETIQSLFNDENPLAQNLLAMDEQDFNLVKILLKQPSENPSNFHLFLLHHLVNAILTGTNDQRLEKKLRIILSDLPQEKTGDFVKYISTLNHLPEKFELEKILANAKVYRLSKLPIIGGLIKITKNSQIKTFTNFCEENLIDVKATTSLDNIIEQIIFSITYLEVIKKIKDRCFDFCELRYTKEYFHVLSSLSDYCNQVISSVEFEKFDENWQLSSASKNLFLKIKECLEKNQTQPIELIFMTIEKIERFSDILKEIDGYFDKSISDEINTLTRSSIEKGQDDNIESAKIDFLRSCSTLDSLIEFDHYTNQIDSSIKKNINAILVNNIRIKPCDWWSFFKYMWFFQKIELTFRESPELKLINKNVINEYLQRLEKTQKEASSILAIEIINNLETSKKNAADLYSPHNLRKMFPLRGKNKISLRESLEKYFEFMTSCYPIWLCDPEVACKIFPLSHEIFDIGIFDEASQARIEDILPVIYRCKQIIVAGDEKQLPPPSYFNNKNEYEESETEKEDMTEEEIEQQDHENSILDEKDLLQVAQKLNFHNTYLTMHYRSHHPNLIDFSNSAFYSDRLKILPKKIDSYDYTPFHFIEVNGAYNNQENYDEADAILEKLRNLILIPGFKKSLGIVTFSVKQKRLIQRKYLELKRNDQQFNAAIKLFEDMVIENEDRSIFFKSLEEVQGDERDIILFSITFGSSDQGIFRQSFGPLIHPGGERRLNVLVTRAKDSIYIFNSIPKDKFLVSFQANFCANQRRAYFYAYLKYTYHASQKDWAKANSVLSEMKKILGYSSPSGEDIGGYTESPLEEEIVDSLRKYIPENRIECQVKEGSFRIDIGIRDASIPDKFILGIEADGAAYHSSPAEIEYDMLRQNILENKGWKLIRIWSTEWWNDPVEEILRVVNEIKRIDNQNKIS